MVPRAEHEIHRFFGLLLTSELAAAVVHLLLLPIDPDWAIVYLLLPVCFGCCCPFVVTTRAVRPG